jgi:hypothetical protein
MILTAGAQNETRMNRGEAMRSAFGWKRLMK